MGTNLKRLREPKNVYREGEVLTRTMTVERRERRRKENRVDQGAEVGQIVEVEVDIEEEAEVRVMRDGDPARRREILVRRRKDRILLTPGVGREIEMSGDLAVAVEEMSKESTRK